MRTIEILLVIIILLGAFLTSSYFGILPPPRAVSQLNLAKLALTTLQTLDADHSLSDTVFKSSSDPAWTSLQQALSACLPPNIVYNLTVYDTQSGSGVLYKLNYSISNAASMGVTSLVSSYLVTSANPNFTVTPQRINNTLYILNCSDSNGWWITGYTAQSLAGDLYNLLSPYFQTPIMVQNTTELGQILNGTRISTLPYENITNAVVINTNGEAVPIPSGYYATRGYDNTSLSYAKYCYMLGNATMWYNWTWVGIVGYPLYYVSNTGLFPNGQNGWGIYGMGGSVSDGVGPAGLNSFLEGLNNETYSYDSTWITGDSSADAGLANVWLSSDASYYCNSYGIYPSSHQTATRALPTSILSRYNLTVTSYVLNQVDNWLPGAFYKHISFGAFLALGLARTPDVRLTAIGLLCGYKPSLSKSQFTVAATSKLVVLQLGNVGGA